MLGSLSPPETLVCGALHSVLVCHAFLYSNSGFATRLSPAMWTRTHGVFYCFHHVYRATRARTATRTSLSRPPHRSVPCFARTSKVVCLPDLHAHPSPSPPTQRTPCSAPPPSPMSAPTLPPSFSAHTQFCLHVPAAPRSDNDAERTIDHVLLTVDTLRAHLTVRTFSGALQIHSTMYSSSTTFTDAPPRRSSRAQSFACDLGPVDCSPSWVLPREV